MDGRIVLLATTAAAAVIGSNGELTVAAVVAAAFVAFGLQARACRHTLHAREAQLAHTAHELRTPLASLQIALELLGRTDADKEAGEFVEEARFAADQLGHLVDDVLDEAALAAGQLQLLREDVAVADLISDTRRLFFRMARQRGLTLVTARDLGLRVQGDARRIRQVLFNLVGNAITFGRPGEKVTLRAVAAGASVHFRVDDEGPGVPEELLPRLFQPFAHGNHKNVASTGLGLHVSRRLARAMGGDLGHAPRPGRGSTFWLALPRAPNEDSTPLRTNVACRAIATR